MSKIKVPLSPKKSNYDRLVEKAKVAKDEGYYVEMLFLVHSLIEQKLKQTLALTHTSFSETVEFSECIDKFKENISNKFFLFDSCFENKLFDELKDWKYNKANFIINELENNYEIIQNEKSIKKIANKGFLLMTKLNETANKWQKKAKKKKLIKKKKQNDKNKNEFDTKEKEIVIKGSVDGASKFLGKISHTSAKEFGPLFNDNVSSHRSKNAIKITTKAQEMLGQHLKNQKLNAHPRIIYSTIENGSWAKDEFLQDLWAGLLASSCSLDGKDEGNLILVGLLSQLTTSQARLIKYVCETTTPFKNSGGWIESQDLIVEADDLKEIMRLDDLHQIDRELDHLRCLGLIVSGFIGNSTKADVTPLALGLQLYVRSQGFTGSPIDFFELK